MICSSRVMVMLEVERTCVSKEHIWLYKISNDSSQAYMACQITRSSRKVGSCER